ncbi:MAG: histidine kinase [Chloroflexi bacterium]|nr:histidine kinase [Chloroflexota bacterium]
MCGGKMPTPDRLEELERELEQVKAQLPRHSIKPSMLARLDELEEEIARLKKDRQSKSNLR